MLNRSSISNWRKWMLPLWAALLACFSAASIASDDHDRARQALEAGEVLPLQTILLQVEREQPGQVLDVELERDHGHSQGSNPDRWIYKIKVLRSGGALVKLKVDARDGTIIGKKNKSEHDGKHEQKETQRNGDGR